MIVSLTIIKYKKRYIPFAFLAMMCFRIPLWLSKNITFYKLMGSGKNGTFDKTPDLQQWAVLTVDRGKMTDERKANLIKTLYGSFISKWIKFFNCNTHTYILTPIEGHGLWDGKKVFQNSLANFNQESKIAVLTRATIRLSRLKNFWGNVSKVASQMPSAKGFITSYGIGEIPWIKQATFSIWETKEDMINFAYKMQQHKEIIQKTRKEKWYSEEMFVRFIIDDCIINTRF